MRPTRLEIEGLGSYATPTTIDFSVLSVAAITGENGAGKSMLAEAITIALFGSAVRADSVRELCSNERMRVVLEFSHAGEDYRVTRELSKKGKVAARLERLGAEGFVEVARDQLAVNRHLAALVGLSKEAFLSTALLAQGDAARFCAADPAKRKAVVSDLLGLERFAVLAEAARRRRGALEAEAQGIERARGALEAECAQRPAAAAEHAVVRDELASAEAVLSAATAAARAAAGAAEELSRLEAERAELEGQRSREERLFARRCDEAAARVAQAARLVQERRESLKDADARCAAAAAAKEALGGLVARLAAQEQHLVAQAGVEEQILRRGEEVRTRLDRATAELDATATRRVEAEERLDALSRHAEDPRCFTCGQALSAELRRQLADALRNELDALDAARAGLEAAVAAETARRKDLLAELHEARGASAAGRARRDELVAKVARAEEAAAAAGAADAAREAAVAALDAAVADEAAARQDAAGVEAEAAEAARAAAARAARLEARRAELGAAFGDADGLREREQAAAAQVEQLRYRLGGLAERLERLEAAEAQAAALRAEKDAATARAGRLGVLERAFGKDGIPRLVLEGALPEIEADIAEVLARLSDTGIEVHLATTRATAKGERETLEVVVRDEHGARPLELFSGGESLRVALAVNAALARLMRRRYGQGADLLFFDEPAALDERGLRALVDWLFVLREEVGLVLVVTHLEEVAAAFDARLVVERDPDAGSRVRLEAA